MPYAARKFSRAKWKREPFLVDENDVPGDALTGCLRTHSNTLSFWNCELDNAAIEDVALALALGADKERVDRVQLVLLDSGAVTSLSRTEQTPGNTCVDELRDQHFDLCDLSARKLCDLAILISEQVQSGGEQCKSLSVGKVRKLIRAAIQGGRVRANQITNENLRAQVEDDLTKTPPPT